MKIQSYNIFWQRIHQTAKNKGFPLRVMFELTYRCNFKCKHCYVPNSYRNKQELKTKQVFSILEQLKDIGCFYLGFTGGEPFIRKDIMNILWFAKKKGFELILYTNGALINEEIAQELQRLSPNKVDITIPAMSKHAFEGVTRMPGSHRKVFNAIDLLHKRGVRLGFKTCMLKENESEIKDIQHFSRSLGALHRLDDILLPRLDGSKEPFKYRPRDIRISGYQDIRRTESAESDFEVANRQTNTDSLFKCGVGVSQAAITPQGGLKMCLMIDYPKYKILNGKGYQEDLKNSWQRLRELVVSIKIDKNYKCNKCKLEPFCKWCPARGWLYNRSFSSCDPQSLRHAELRHK